MKKRLFVFTGFLLLASCSRTSHHLPKQEIQPYVDFIENQTATARDYILSLFRKYDIVVLCERDHRELTQYDLYLSILKDPYFINTVGNVFTEVGVRTLNPRFNRFMHNDSLADDQVEKELLFFQRIVTFWPLWEKYNYYYFIKNCYAINRSLPADQKINFFPSDVPFQWNKIQNVEDLKVFWEKFMIKDHRMLRDSVMAAQIIETYDSLRAYAKRKKALMIMNYRHAFNDVFDPKGYNTARFLFQKYHGSIANVFVHNHMEDNPPYHTIHKGKWDAAFQVAAVTDVGFDFRNSPFGKDSFDYYAGKENLTYQDVFTGMVFFKPLEEFELVIGIPGLVDQKFLEELLRREEILYQMRKRKHSMSPDELVHYYSDKRTFKLRNLKKIKKEIDSWIE